GGGDVVGDQGEGVELVGADEGVQVGVVGGRVVTDARRLAMAGGSSQRRREHRASQQASRDGERPDQSERTFHTVRSLFTQRGGFSEAAAEVAGSSSRGSGR